MRSNCFSDLPNFAAVKPFKNFYGWVLSIRVISADGHYGPIVTIASRDQFKPARIGENLLVNFNSPHRVITMLHFLCHTIGFNLTQYQIKKDLGDLHLDKRSVSSFPINNNNKNNNHYMYSLCLSSQKTILKINRVLAVWNNHRGWRSQVLSRQQHWMKIITGQQ